MLETINVVIDRSGHINWNGLKNYQVEFKDMLNDLKPLICNSDLRLNYERILNVYPLLATEMTNVAKIFNVKKEEIIALNVFYDTHKLLCGCTAYLGNGFEGPIHLHSLDWDTARDTLEKHLKFFRYENQKDKSIIYSIGWPGYLGIFWGMRLDSFSISLNAVWSEVNAKTSYPLGIFLRNIFVNCSNYQEALDSLKSSQISSDCILAVSGVSNGEFAIIERTPQQSYIRKRSNYCLATNHYCNLKVGSNREGYIETGEEIFGLGTKERYDSAAFMINEKMPLNEQDCFELASKEPIENELTILKAVYKTTENKLLVRFPGNSKTYELKETDR